MPDDDIFWLTKDYGKHSIVVMCRTANNDGIIQCDTCRVHMHIDLDFTDNASTMFLEAELQMHAAGVSDGWHDGLGFSIE